MKLQVARTLVRLLQLSWFSNFFPIVAGRQRGKKYAAPKSQPRAIPVAFKVKLLNKNLEYGQSLVAVSRGTSRYPTVKADRALTAE